MAVRLTKIRKNIRSTMEARRHAQQLAIIDDGGGGGGGGNSLTWNIVRARNGEVVDLNFGDLAICNISDPNSGDCIVRLPDVRQGHGKMVAWKSGYRELNDLVYLNIQSSRNDFIEGVFDVYDVNDFTQGTYGSNTDASNASRRPGGIFVADAETRIWWCIATFNDLMFSRPG